MVSPPGADMPQPAHDVVLPAPSVGPMRHNPFIVSSPAPSVPSFESVNACPAIREQPSMTALHRARRTVPAPPPHFMLMK